MHAEATVCPHCHSDHRPLSFWRRASVYIPVLSFCVAIIGMTPNLLKAIAEYRNPPKARVVVADVDMQAHGLVVSLTNVGQSIGISSRFVRCVVTGRKSGEAPLAIEFVGRLQTAIPAQTSTSLAFDAEIRGITKETDGVETRWLDSSQSRPISDLPGLFGDEILASVGDGIGRTIVPLADEFGLDCEIRIIGDNEPPAALVRFAFNRGLSGDPYDVTRFEPGLIP